jgi:hypothetical protein
MGSESLVYSVDPSSCFVSLSLGFLLPHSRFKRLQSRGTALPMSKFDRRRPKGEHVSFRLRRGLWSQSELMAYRNGNGHTAGKAD